MSELSEIISRARVGASLIGHLPELPGYNGSRLVIDDIEAERISTDVYAAIDALQSRITELEASLADSNEAVQVFRLLLSEADAVNSQLVTEAAHKTKMIEAGARRDECKINLIKKQNEQIAALKKKLRDEYDDYPADELQDQSHSANTVGGPTPVMDAAPAWEMMAIAWLRGKAAGQAQNNERWPDHAKCYPRWTLYVDIAQELANELEREHQKREDTRNAGESDS